MKKALPLTLVLTGAALLIMAAVFWIDSSTSNEPQSFGKTLLDWVTLIAGIGASFKGWMDLFKPDKPTSPTTNIEVKSGNPQISTGNHARNIQTDTYIENQTVQQPPEPKTPKSLNQLPTPPLDFIGREKELAQLRQNIEKGLVISGVQGMGGIGKTVLGLKLAEQISTNYSDGQIYLDLRGAHEQTPLTPEQVMAHVIRSFHPEAALPLDFGELGAMYRSTIGNKKVLLFYDNARDEKQLKDLLPPKSCVLFVTSRQYFTLPGLVAIDLETLTPTDSIALVQEIAPKVSDKDAGAVAKQCGYLPLAVRAAVGVLSRRPDWSPAELIKRLGDNRARLGLVESSLSLSYNTLDANLQKYLRQLGVFAAPFDKEAILAIWFDERELRSQRQEVDDILGELLMTSLLKYDQNTNEYYFHDLAHLFLEDKLRQDDNSDEVLWRYAQYYLALAIIFNNDYKKGGESILPALAKFSKIWVHIDEVSKRLSNEESGWRLPDDSKYWLKDSLGKIQDILTSCFSPNDYLPFAQRALDTARQMEDKDIVRRYLNDILGGAYSSLGKMQDAIQSFQEALGISQEFEDKRGIGASLDNLGGVYSALGEIPKAIEYHQQSLLIAREVGNRYSEGTNLGNLGMAYSVLGDTHKSVEFYEQALSVAKEVKDRGQEGKWIGMLGNAYSAIGDMRKAIKFYEQAFGIAQEIGDKDSEGAWLGMLGTTYSVLENARKAIEYYEQALSIAREMGSKGGEAAWLAALGNSYETLGDKRKALEFYEQALAVAREIESKFLESIVLGSLGLIKNPGDAELGLDISRKIGARRNEALLLCAIASTKRSEGKLAESLSLHEQALKLSKETEDVYSSAQILNNLANTYADLGNYSKAIESYQNALQLAKTVEYEELIANISWNLASVYYEQQNYELAEKHMQVMIGFEQKINHPNAKADLETLNEVRNKIQNTPKPEDKPYAHRP